MEGDSSAFICFIYFHISLKDYFGETPQKKSKKLEKIIDLWTKADWFLFEL